MSYIFAVRTHFLGLSVSVLLQFAEEGVLLGQQHFDVLHTHSDYPGANVRLKSVDTLVGQRGDVVVILKTWGCRCEGNFPCSNNNDQLNSTICGTIAILFLKLFHLFRFYCSINKHYCEARYIDAF